MLLCAVHTATHAHLHPSLQRIFKSWCHNPVSTLSLCLLAQGYHLASALVAELCVGVLPPSLPALLGSPTWPLFQRRAGGVPRPAAPVGQAGPPPGIAHFHPCGLPPSRRCSPVRRSPVCNWPDLRLQLLQPEYPQHSHLLRALYGLLMLLPQSAAFNTLRNRLNSVTSLHVALARSGCAAAPGPMGRIG